MHMPHQTDDRLRKHKKWETKQIQAEEGFLVTCGYLCVAICIVFYFWFDCDGDTPADYKIKLDSFSGTNKQ